jgi:phage-related protein (TIGR01555 family)
MKNFQNAIVMDREDDYDQKNLGAIFTGLASVWEQLRLNLCAALKIPKNKLFGESAGGFSSGEDALENYNSTVEALREELEPAILDVVELRCQQLFGFMPEDVDIEWQPLRVLTGNEAEDVKVKKQQRIMERFQSGLETAQEASIELKKEGLLSVDTEVLRGERDVDPIVNQESPEAKKDKNPKASAEKDFAKKAGSEKAKKKLLASA